MADEIKALVVIGLACLFLTITVAGMAATMGSDWTITANEVVTPILWIFGIGVILYGLFHR